MSDKTYIYIRKNAGNNTFTMPGGFSSNVEIHAWGAGGGAGIRAVGSGGGYATTVATINSGDTVEILVGKAGGNGNYPSGGIGGAGFSDGRFKGGTAGNVVDEDADTSAGGGGGSASAVVVNSTPVCVAAGGGGAGGLGDDSGSGIAGNPGGVYSSLTGNTIGGNSPNGGTSGGGGGGGYLGGSAGASYGDDQGNAPGGWGGQNYGDVTLPGSGIAAGGKTTSYYPSGSAYANAGEDGYVVLILERQSQMSIKESGVWKTISDSYVKISEPRVVAVATSQTFAAIPGTKTIYTATGSSSYVVPPGITSLTIDMIASGGSGSGGSDFGTGGGGSGGFYQGYTYAVTPGAKINYSVGASGENTIFGDLTCTPGGNGQFSGPGGTAGSPNGTVGGASSFPGFAIGGNGADSPFGKGGAGGVGGGPSVSGNSGASATGYGAGGGGGGNNRGGGGGSPAFISIIPSGPSTRSFTVPAGVYTVTVSYVTPTGLQTHVQAVTPGDIIPISVGDFGQESRFGSFTIPEFSKQVLRYRGQVDHIVAINVQVVTATGGAVSSVGYNATQISAAAAAGITYSIPTEIYHGDLYSTIDFSPITTSSVLNNIKLIGTKNSGRNFGPTISIQPTASNGYTAGVTLAYDPSSNEDYYDITLTLQQQGYFTINYDLPVVASGWRKIKQVWVKEGNEWKAVVNRNILPS
jgi:hypothetical protein